MSKTRKSKKAETPLETLEKWLARPDRITVSWDAVMAAGWEAGQGHPRVDNPYEGEEEAHYELFRFPEGHICHGKCVVIMWSDGGDLVIC